MKSTNIAAMKTTKGTKKAERKPGRNRKNHRGPPMKAMKATNTMKPMKKKPTTPMKTTTKVAKRETGNYSESEEAYDPGGTYP